MVAFKNLMPHKKRQEEQFDDDLEVIPGVDFLTTGEMRTLFDQRVHETLGISGEEFLRRWDAGEYRSVPDDREGRKVARLVMMLPFVRPTSD